MKHPYGCVSRLMTSRAWWNTRRLWRCHLGRRRWVAWRMMGALVNWIGCTVSQVSAVSGRCRSCEHCFHGRCGGRLGSGRGGLLWIREGGWSGCGGAYSTRPCSCHVLGAVRLYVRLTALRLGTLEHVRMALMDLAHTGALLWAVATCHASWCGDHGATRRKRMVCVDIGVLYVFRAAWTQGTCSWFLHCFRSRVKVGRCVSMICFCWGWRAGRVSAGLAGGGGITCSRPVCTLSRQEVTGLGWADLEASGLFTMACWCMLVIVELWAGKGGGGPPALVGHLDQLEG